MKSTSWEAFAGMSTINVGTRRNGKPHAVLAIEVLVVTSEADAKRLEKKHPQLKFVKRTGRSVPTSSNDLTKEIK